MNLEGSRWASSKPNSYRPWTSPSKSSRPLASSATTKPGTGATCASATINSTQDKSDAAAQARAERAHEFARHRRLLRRLRWKLPALATAHRLATSVDVQHPHYAQVDTSQPTEVATARAEAELMFKLDWFEYYALLERALLHLLGVWGIRVRRHGRADAEDSTVMASSVNASNSKERQVDSESIIGPRVHASPYGHRFHANVLASLDMPSNPLHETLGSGETRRQLGAAKQLRNLWKDADEREDAAPLSLSGYDTEQMLLSIFAGFEAALDVARRALEQDSHVAMEIEEDETSERVPRPLYHDGSADQQGGRDVEGNEDGDLIMEDAMDWEHM